MKRSIYYFVLKQTLAAQCIHKLSEYNVLKNVYILVLKSYFQARSISLS